MFVLLLCVAFVSSSLAVEEDYAQQSPVMWLLEAQDPVERSLRSYRLEKKERAAFGDRQGHFPFYKGLGRK